MLDRLHWLPIACGIDYKIATLTCKVVHLKQPPSLAKHLKLMSMHFSTRNNDQLLLQHPPVGTHSYGRRTFRFSAPTVWNNLPYDIRNAPSVRSFRKKLKTYYFGILSRPPDGWAMPCLEVGLAFTLPDMWILTLLYIYGYFSFFHKPAFPRISGVTQIKFKLRKLNLNCVILRQICIFCICIFFFQNCFVILA